jgi:hypothetical protein
MHIPDHADILPKGVDPIPFPNTKEETEMLRCLLNAELYPKCADTGTQRDRKDPTGDEDR